MAASSDAKRWHMANLNGAALQSHHVAGNACVPLACPSPSQALVTRRGILFIHSFILILLGATFFALKHKYILYF